MRLTIEKVLILKSCSMFSKIPEDSLAELAAITEEVVTEAGETIFSKGDLGKSMYIIVYGKVKVHDGDKTFAELGNRDIFGEMAILDAEVRSASITAIEETLMFRIDQDPFFELMSEHSIVTRGILQVLCARLRKLQTN